MACNEPPPSPERTPQRVLVTWGTQRGGTEGIARMVAEILAQSGYEVVASPAGKIRDVSSFDAAIVGGALYANLFHADARRFVNRHLAQLRRIPVWLFSSGPLDDSAEQAELPPVPQVAVLLARVGACGHATFGGRLSPDARGFPAAAMAKRRSGDWRNRARIGAWAADIARALPSAKPGVGADPPARAVSRLLWHGSLGWASCAAAMATLLRLAPLGVALTLHAVLAPLIFVAIAAHYFRGWGARDPLPTAVTWTSAVMLLDAAIVAGAVLHDFNMFRSLAGTWLPFALIFSVTWATGTLLAMMPSPAQRARAPARRSAAT